MLCGGNRKGNTCAGDGGAPLICQGKNFQNILDLNIIISFLYEFLYKILAFTTAIFNNNYKPYIPSNAQRTSGFTFSALKKFLTAFTPIFCGFLHQNCCFFHTKIYALLQQNCCTKIWV